MVSDPDHHWEVSVLNTADPETLNTSSLVLSAAAIDHRIRTLADGRQEISVITENQERALYELYRYREENRHWPLPAEGDTDEYTPMFRGMSLVVAGGLALLYSITGDWHQQSSWFAAGAGDSAAILNGGQWYRLVTPLTLHADIGHLLSNCLLGGLLLHFFFHLTGNGIGLLALLGSAVLGNLLNVLGHGPGHLFVGFSTAIFSVIGMLCTISHAGKSGRPLLHVFIPIMAGLALLAFLGSSGERTDLGGHLFGLLSGLIFGNLVRLPWFLALRDSFTLQTTLGAISWSLCVLCWLLALA
jgi:membrane associated rhomboid family serine protease